MQQNGIFASGWESRMYLCMNVSSSIFKKSTKKAACVVLQDFEKLMQGRIKYLDAVNRNRVRFKCIPTSFPSCDESDFAIVTCLNTLFLSEEILAEKSLQTCLHNSCACTVYINGSFTFYMSPDSPHSIGVTGQFRDSHFWNLKYHAFFNTSKYK